MRIYAKGHKIETHPFLLKIVKVCPLLDKIDMGEWKTDVNK